MVNSRRWQKESDEWVKMTDKNREMKEKRNKNRQIQGYKVEIIFYSTFKMLQTHLTGLQRQWTKETLSIKLKQFTQHQ